MEQPGDSNGRWWRSLERVMVISGSGGKRCNLAFGEEPSEKNLTTTLWK
jgi:hypothetical protein